jgi:mannose-6-phosphate isomerase-like protein (cupin superfamily)
MKTKIVGYRSEAEFHTAEGLHIVELFNQEDDGSFSIARARFDPGVTAQLHALDGVTERYVILEAKGRVEIGDEPGVEVGLLDCVHIPKGEPQRITNVGRQIWFFSPFALRASRRMPI